MRNRQHGRDSAAESEDEEIEADRPRWGARALRALTRRPKEGIAVAIGLAASAAVMINALFLQSGPHPAPIFASVPKPAPAKDATGSVVTVLPRPRPTDLDTAKAEASAPPRPRGEPVMRTPAKRVLAVQRVLTEFGYGQISPTGNEDAATVSAIQKFERGHKMPITGQISERLMRELATMAGRSLE